MGCCSIFYGRVTINLNFDESIGICGRFFEDLRQTLEIVVRRPVCKKFHLVTANAEML